jgi:hypothetical protein
MRYCYRREILSDLWPSLVVLYAVDYMRAFQTKGDPRNGARGHGDSGASSNRNDLPGVLEAFLDKEVPEAMIRPA